MKPLLMPHVILALSAHFHPISGAAGTTFYVAPTGNDTNPGSEAHPFKTIQKAANTAMAGEWVILRAGTYRERVVPVNSGRADQEIVYTAEPGAMVVLDGTGIALPDDLAGLFHVSGKSHIRISGLRIIAVGPNNDNAGILVQNSHFITVENNVISNTISSGIGVWDSDHVTVEGNTLDTVCTGGWQEGITVAITETFLVRSNRVVNCKKEGICLKHGSRNGTAAWNRVERSSAVGIYVDAWDRRTYNIEVSHNIVHDAGSDGFALASEMGGSLENVRLHNNLAYHNHYRGFSVGINGPGGTQGRHPMNGIEILNNTSVNNGWEDWGGGIAVDNPDAQNVLVANNICSQNRYFQLVVGGDVSPRNVTLDHNLIDGYQGTEGETYGANAVTGNPRFVNPAAADYHLRASSPAIDAGTNHVSLLPGLDCDGQPRMFNDRVDIGADEAVVRSMGLVRIASGLQTTWDVVPDARCQLQRCNDLTGKTWMPIGEATIGPQKQWTITDTDPITAHGFYRLVWWKP